MSIWNNPNTLDEINAFHSDTLDGHLGITFTELGDDFIKGTMPATQRTKQPFGLIHGGANVSLAESLGSVGANLCVDRERFYCVGLEINANHVKAVSSGQVTGVAKPLHIGGKTQVWDIVITDDAGDVSCISRLTVAVLRK